MGALAGYWVKKAHATLVMQKVAKMDNKKEENGKGNMYKWKDKLGK